MSFWNIQTVIGIFLSLGGTIFLMWGSHINSTKSTQQIIDTQEANTKKVLNSTEEISRIVLKLAGGNDFAGALRIYNNGSMVVKKGIIKELKQKALLDINIRQHVIDFLGSLNDWVSEDEDYEEFFLNPQLEWSRWKDEKELFKKDGSVFNKEQQILSLEASWAIDAIIFQHSKTQTKTKLHFFQKNVLGPMFIKFNFEHGNIDFSKARIFGLYMMGSMNVESTHFESATYYGKTLFRDMLLPEIIYRGGDFGTDYLGELVFLNVEFPFGTNLTNSIFHEDVNFVTVKFHQKAHFYISTFKGVARFANCDFQGDTGFNGATFHKNVSFETSRFHDKTQFVTVNFTEGASFKGASFSKSPDFSGTDKNQISDLVLQ